MPFLQAGITGVLVVIIGGVVLRWRAAPVAGGVTILVMWALLLWDHRRLLWRFEQVIDLDVNRDGAVGPPPKPPEPGWITIDGSKARHAATKSAAAKKREAVLAFVNRVQRRTGNDLPTGQKEMRGMDLPHGYKVTDDFHAEVGARLIEHGLAVRNSNGSWTLDATPAEVAAAITAW